ncbi:MAG TPA: SIS domain-containing protein [Candidatus Dormibacteraeota bacterium]
MAGALALATDLEYIRTYCAETSEIIGRIEHEPIASAIEILFGAWRDGRTVFVMGNGGSASTATHFACDLAKWTALEGKKRFRVLCLNDNVPLVSALTNDEGWAAVFSAQLEAWLEPNDVIVGFSVHGGTGRGNAGAWSQNLPRAIELAKARGARVIGFAGDTGGVMASRADACIVIPPLSQQRLTPHTEGLHVVLHHLVCDRLRGRIAEA